MTYTGIDYGKYAGSNRNADTGVHYGVISQHSLNMDVIGEVISDGAYYGEPTCPECSGKAIPADDLNPDDIETLKEGQDAHDLPPYNHGCTDFVCINCAHSLDSSEVYSEEMLGWSYEGEGYKLQDCLNSDVFVIESPYYTYARFCSPCVPGACNLDSPLDDVTIDGAQDNHPTLTSYPPRSYALGHDWFERGKAPYRVFKVADGSEVLSRRK